MTAHDLQFGTVADETGLTGSCSCGRWTVAATPRAGREAAYDAKTAELLVRRSHRNHIQEERLANPVPPVPVEVSSLPVIGTYIFLALVGVAALASGLVYGPGAACITLGAGLGGLLAGFECCYARYHPEPELTITKQDSEP